MSLLTDDEIREIGFGSQSLKFARAVESAVLAKLAMHDEKPVAWRYKYRFKDIGETGAYEYHSHDFATVAQLPKGEPLYTETQYKFAQQSVAKACACICQNEMDNYYYGDEGRIAAEKIAEYIHNGEWVNHI